MLGSVGNVEVRNLSLFLGSGNGSDLLLNYYASFVKLLCGSYLSYLFGNCVCAARLLSLENSLGDYLSRLGVNYNLACYCRLNSLALDYLTCKRLNSLNRCNRLGYCLGLGCNLCLGSSFYNLGDSSVKLNGHKLGLGSILGALGYGSCGNRCGLTCDNLICAIAGYNLASYYGSRLCTGNDLCIFVENVYLAGYGRSFLLAADNLSGLGCGYFATSRLYCYGLILENRYCFLTGILGSIGDVEVRNLSLFLISRSGLCLGSFSYLFGNCVSAASLLSLENSGLDYLGSGGINYNLACYGRLFFLAINGLNCLGGNNLASNLGLCLNAINCLNSLRCYNLTRYGGLVSLDDLHGVAIHDDLAEQDRLCRSCLNGLCIFVENDYLTGLRRLSRDYLSICGKLADIVCSGLLCGLRGDYLLTVLIGCYCVLKLGSTLDLLRLGGINGNCVITVLDLFLSLSLKSLCRVGLLCNCVRAFLCTVDGLRGFRCYNLARFGRFCLNAINCLNSLGCNNLVSNLGRDFLAANCLDGFGYNNLALRRCFCYRLILENCYSLFACVLGSICDVEVRNLSFFLTSGNGSDLLLNYHTICISLLGGCGFSCFFCDNITCRLLGLKNLRLDHLCRALVYYKLARYCRLRLCYCDHLSIGFCNLACYRGLGLILKNGYDLIAAVKDLFYSLCTRSNRSGLNCLYARARDHKLRALMLNNCISRSFSSTGDLSCLLGNFG